MNTLKENYDSVVIGAGHAGCEAALALARTNNKTLLLTMSLDSVAFLACNPSIGGTAKGHLVCEIDALGGEMGKNADATLLQLRMLNEAKGPAVRSLRAQVDKQKYHERMKSVLENTPNLFLRQAEAKQIVVENGKVVGVETCQGQFFECKSVVVCTGVYLQSKIIVGKYTRNVGPNGFAPANELTKSLQDLGFEIFRFKTGTPARIHADSIDFSKMEVQYGQDNIQSFSFSTKRLPKSKRVCYLTYTNDRTHEVINNNITRCPMLSGEIVGVGPRYCPSIESKVQRFADRERHQVFLEPEADCTKEFYVQGMSTSMPVDVQKQMYETISGLENCFIMRDAYAIEYDCINSLQLLPSLMSKSTKGLFFAGQVNGTSGYEEAAAQGLIAGINANHYNTKKQPLVLGRDQAYIGVLIDDLVTKGTNEPYRMMTSRAEYRLLLRQDNADERLTEIGREIGLVDEICFKRYQKKQQEKEKAAKILQSKVKPGQKLDSLCELAKINKINEGISLLQLLKKTGVTIEMISTTFDCLKKIKPSILKCVETNVKYEGYIKQQQEDVEKSKKHEQTLIPENFDYSKVKGIKEEARSKLSTIRPTNLGQASRVSGVSPADVAVLAVAVKFFEQE